MNCNNCIYNGNGCYALRGPTGAQGATGPAGTITIGTVTTGEAGTDATVTNVGTSTNAILNFVIPQGATGEAATITIGTVTTGETASVTNVGTATNAILDFVIPIKEALYASLQNETAVTQTETGTIPLTLIESNGITVADSVITITETGVYEIEYMVSAEAPVNAVVGLLINDTNVTNTNTKLEDNKNVVTYKTIRTLNENNTIALGLITVTGTLTLEADGVNAYLVINKL